VVFQDVLKCLEAVLGILGLRRSQEVRLPGVVLDGGHRIDRLGIALLDLDANELLSLRSADAERAIQLTAFSLDRIGGQGERTHGRLAKRAAKRLLAGLDVRDL